MAAVSVAAVRQRVAARVLLLGGSWTESPIPEPLFGAALVPDTIPSSTAHLCYAVGVGETRPLPGAPYRGNMTDGHLVETTTVVRFLYRQAPKDQRTSYDGMLAAEHDLVKQVMAIGAVWPVDLKVGLVSAKRTVPAPGEWSTSSVEFTVIHQLALA